MRRTLLAPLTIVYTTLVIAGIAFLFGWVASGLEQFPNVVDSVFLAFPFAVCVVTVRSTVRPIVPILFLVLQFLSVLLLILVPPIFDGSEPTVDASTAIPIPDAPLTVWGASEIVYAHTRQGRELQTVVTVDRGVRERDDRPRLRYEPRRFVAFGETVLSSSPAYTADLVGSDETRVLSSIRSDIRDTQERFDYAFDARVSPPFSLSASVRRWIPPVLWERWYGVLLIGVWAITLVLVWTPARATRWPLMNLLLAFGYVRLLFALPRLTDLFFGISLVSERLPATLQALRLPLVLALVALIMAIVAWILPPVDQLRSGAGP